ncbi:MAG: radical SAM protein [Desulfovibrio sp.]|jgi:MoaA/NifB/PqqE/SkfB family radical SAM enzyme|nr:radical SAM protein [Desulfovibrio sp.]
MKTPSGRTDPFDDPSLRGPGVWRSLREAFGGLRRLLAVAQVEVTSFCPGGCVYCPHTTMKGRWKARHMRPETFVRLWPLFLETERVHLQGWGEPLLHPRFLDMVSLARRADCRVSTTTCGLVMHEPLAEGIVQSGIDIMAFSLTGTSEAANKAARTGVDFGRLLDAVRLLRRVREKRMAVHLEIHFAYLVLASQMDEVLALPDLMQELGVHAAVVSTLDYIPTAAWKDEAFAPHEKGKTARAGALLEEASARAAGMGLALYYSLPGDSPGSTCLEHPEKSVYVDAEGNLSPCIYVNLPTEDEDPMRRVFGSALAMNPLDIWRGDDFSAFREAMVFRRPDAPCVECPKRFASGNRLTLSP